MKKHSFEQAIRATAYFKCLTWKEGSTRRLMGVETGRINLFPQAMWAIDNKMFGTSGTWPNNTGDFCMFQIVTVKFYTFETVMADLFFRQDLSVEESVAYQVATWRYRFLYVTSSSLAFSCHGTSTMTSWSWMRVAKRDAGCAGKLEEQTVRSLRRGKNVFHKCPQRPTSPRSWRMKFDTSKSDNSISKRNFSILRNVAFQF